MPDPLFNFRRDTTLRGQLSPAKIMGLISTLQLGLREDELVQSGGEREFEGEKASAGLAESYVLSN